MTQVSHASLRFRWQKNGAHTLIDHAQLACDNCR